MYIIPDIIERCKTISFASSAIYFYYQNESSIVHTKGRIERIDNLKATLHMARFLLKHKNIQGASAYYYSAICQYYATENDKEAYAILKDSFTKEEIKLFEQYKTKKMAKIMFFAKIPFAVNRTMKLRDWYLSEDTLKQTLLKGAIWEVVAAFAGKLRLSDEDQGRYSELVRRTIVYIREHLTACLTINAVANGVFCFPGTLTQAFRNELGVTIAQYIEDLVLQEAQWRLLDTEDTIGKISADLGFCDQFYFTRRFTKRFQITPREYRKNRTKYSR